jgi:phenylacetate-CoA ligase
LPTLPRVTGRSVDCVVTLDGRRIPGTFFAHYLGLQAHVRRFQVVQHTESRLTVNLVLAPASTDEDRETIERTIRQFVGEMMTVEIEIRDEIPLTPAGKLHVVVNEWLRGRGAGGEPGKPCTEH